MTRGESAGDQPGLSRREAIGAAVAGTSMLLVPAAARADAAPAFPVTVRISWRTGEAHSGGAGTIAAVTAAVTDISGAGRPVWVHRLA